MSKTIAVVDAGAGSASIARRWLQLLGGLLLAGVSLAILVEAGLGLSPWDVLHQGIARRTGLGIGIVVVGSGVVVLLAWIPLRQRPGPGTVANAILVGLAAEGALVVLPPVDSASMRLGLLLAGVGLNGFATAAYIGAGLGPGPRDGLMTGLAARGVPLGRARTSVELVALSGGWLLGGTVGLGTVVYALAIGPLVQRLLPLLTVTAPGRPAEGRVGIN